MKRLCLISVLVFAAGLYALTSGDVTGTYYDATTSNTWPTDAQAYPTLSDWAYSTPTYVIYDQWFLKTGSTSAIGGTAFQGEGYNLPQLTTTITGVDPAKSYDVYVVFHARDIGGTWFVYAGLEGCSMALYDETNTDYILAASTLISCQAKIGTITGMSSFAVNVDGPASQTNGGQRAWYDGVALVEVSSPVIPSETDYADMVYDIYIDADSQNTWPSDAISYPALGDWLSTAATENMWHGLENNIAALYGTAFEGFGSALPKLTMNVDGIDSGKTYDVYAVCWVKKDAGNDYWYTYAGLEDDSIKLCDYDTADIAFSDGVYNIQGVELYLGQVSGKSSFTVDVAGPDTDPSSRVWFDGIALVDAKVDTVGSAPAPGRYDYAQDEVVQLNAYDFVDCPHHNVFSRWIGDVADPYSPQTTVIMDSDKTVIAVFTDVISDTVCGDTCHPILMGDVNADCMVDISDLAILAKDWALDGN